MEKEPTRKNSKFTKLIKALLKDETGLFAWDAEGKAIVVSDVSRFEQAVMPRYMRHTHFLSFVRQLNLYGFTKKLAGKRAGGATFSNPDFTRESARGRVLRRKRQAAGEGSPLRVLTRRHSLLIKRLF
jgi:hypothetical protein